MSTTQEKQAWTAGLDMPEAANNNPDKRLLWKGSMLIGDFRSKWVSQEEAKAHCRLAAAAPELAEALRDALSGWRYIRQAHGDLYGVGWDRVEQAARAAMEKAGVLP